MYRINNTDVEFSVTAKRKVADSPALRIDDIHCFKNVTPVTIVSTTVIVKSSQWLGQSGILVKEIAVNYG